MISVDYLLIQTYDERRGILEKIKTWIDGESILKLSSRKKIHLKVNSANKEIIVDDVKFMIPALVEEVYENYGIIFQNCEFTNLKIGTKLSYCRIENSKVQKVDIENTSFSTDWKTKILWDITIKWWKICEINCTVGWYIKYHPQEQSEYFSINKWGKIRTTQKIFINREITTHVGENQNKKQKTKNLIIEISAFNNLNIKNIDVKEIYINNERWDAQKINIQNIETEKLYINKENDGSFKNTTISLNTIDRKNHDALENDSVLLMWWWDVNLYIEHINIKKIWHIILDKLHIQENSQIYDKIPNNIKSKENWSYNGKDGFIYKYTKKYKNIYNIFNQLYTLSLRNNNTDYISHYY